MITTSCHHQVKDCSDIIPAMIKSESLDHDRGFVPAVAYMTLCKQCYTKYLSDDLILFSQQEADDCIFE